MNAWRRAPCPCGKAVLGEARGTDGEFRKRCPKCRNYWIVSADGTVRPDPEPPLPVPLVDECLGRVVP